MATILIVEDDPLMLRLYQKIFTFEKYQVEVASDGEDGLQKARSIKPDIMLLDIMMPKMNGLEVLRNLKLDPAMKTLPVIMLTNLAGQKDAETALSEGAVKYIVKSEHDPKEVANLVKEIVAGYTRNEIPTVGAESASSTEPETPAAPEAPPAAPPEAEVPPTPPTTPPATPPTP